jgi:hypothetical protein
MQRIGLTHISSMTAFATPHKPQPVDHTNAPWNTHWSKLCQHELVARLKEYPSGVRAKRQCIKCGQGVGAVVSMSGVTEPWDDQLEQSVLSEYQAEERKYKSETDEFWRWHRGEKSSDWWNCYHRYLRSSVWQVKRQLVLDRCGGICESCGQSDAEHVHHLKYPETFGLEPLWYLRAVCVPCHELIHPHMRGG